MNVDYRQPVDIANRAMQHCGSRRITTMTEATDRASEVNSCYDKLRSVELRRAVWSFATRKARLRPIGDDTMLVTFATFDATKAYPRFYPALATSGRIYQSQFAIAANTNPINDATAGKFWTRYFGGDVAQPWNAQDSYARGEIVYSPAGGVFLALADDVETNPASGPPAWDATISYRAGDTVTYLTLVYQSNNDLNLNLVPGVSGWTLTSTLVATQVAFRVGQDWLALTGATLDALELAYPIGSGPFTSPNSKNVFRLPVGWLREAPQDPKAGGVSFLGAPSGLGYSDWEYENGYLTSGSCEFIYRFVADVSDVLSFDPMFCELLAARVALEVCERITQSDSKMSTIASLYSKFGSEARIVNGIETGATEPPMDDYLACRA